MSAYAAVSADPVPATDIDPGPLANARGQLARTADRLGLDQSTRDLLNAPIREFHVSIPVPMDGGTTRVFRGYRLQHNDARGPAKGGIRAANGPTTAPADWQLQKRGIRIVPDILANAGGVTCSYFEQVQGNSNHYWPRAEVLEKLDARMQEAYRAASDTAVRERTSLRDAAYLIAVSRVAHACRTRGWV